MTFAASDYCKNRILTLCDKVMEVVHNNDWPTEEGQNRSDEPPCYIEQIVNDIKKELGQ